MVWCTAIQAVSRWSRNETTEALQTPYLCSPKTGGGGSDRAATAVSRVRNLPVSCEVVQSAVVVAHDKLLGFSVCPSSGRARVAQVSALQKGPYQALVVVLPKGQNVNKRK